MNALPDAAELGRLDEADPLREARERFALPDGVIYLDGNSLGPPPRRALERLEEAAREEWGRGLIKSWNDAGWMELPLATGRKLAGFIGVDGDEVVCLDTVTILIFKLASALSRKKPEAAIAVERGDFPTDGYVLEGLAALTGCAFKYVEPGTSPAALDPEIGVLVRSAVHYKTAEIADIARWEAEARETALDIIWDLSHATGLVDLKLKRDGARFAVGCGYKFLNGGPGAPAFVYCRSDEIAGIDHPVTGWLGHDTPFDFVDGYRPAEGIRRFITSSPSILAITSLNAALDAYDAMALSEVEAKARALGDIFLQAGAQLGLDTISPGIGARRGGHVCLRHEHGYAIVQALIARGIIGDFRAPDLMRFGFNPLYLSYREVGEAARQMIEVVETREYERPEFNVRKAVT